MRLLIDANLSGRVAELLRAEGYDAVHVRERSLMDADDETILAFALQEDRVLVSEDSDFSALLARHRASAPSFVLIRSAEPLLPDDQVRLLLNNLPSVETDLREGSIVAFSRGKIRVHRLPI